MKLYYGGAEIKAWKDLLISENIPTVSISFVGLTRRPKETAESFDYPGELFIDSGAYTYNRPDTTLEFEDAYETAAQYMEFVKLNIDSATLVSEFDAQQLGDDVIGDMRTNFYNTLPPEKFMPIWHPEYGRDNLEHLCSSYPVVGVCQADIHGDTEHVPIFNQMISRYGVRLHGVGITSKKLLEAVKWDSASSTSWLSPSIYGDTFVWTGRELKRYPKAYKDRRRTHRVLFTDNGFDAEAIESDDSNELLKLSLWSWQQYIAHINGVTTMPRNKPEEKTETTSSEVNNQAIQVRTETQRRDTVMLPVMANIFPENEEEQATNEPILIVRSESMRVCDSCFLKDKCPGFQPRSTCLYNIPIEIRTKPQLQALHDALIEMQTHRVLFMKMAEDLGGGYADPNLSSEIDRLNRMIKTRQDSDKNSFSMTINATETPSGPSFMQTFLGSDAVEKIRAIEPVQADDIIKESEIVEAELVESS